MTTLFSDNDLQKQPKYLYYDAVIGNTHNINEDEPYLKFNEKRSIALLKKPNDYKMSVIRFMCDTHTLPIMQPSIMAQDDQHKYFPNDINHDRTIYSITIEKDGVFKHEYINFIPQDTTKMKPTSFNADGTPYYLSSYYDIFSYEHFISMCNQTIKSILASSSFNYPYGEAYPTFVYDSSSKKISFQAPTTEWTSNESTDYKIYVNTALYRLFNSMPANHLNDKNVNGMHYQLDTYNHANNIVTVINYDTEDGSYTDSTGKEFYFITQEYSTCDLWSPVSSIIFTSSTLNVEDTPLSAFHEYIKGREIVEGEANRTLNIISDISMPSNYLPNIFYSSQNHIWCDIKNEGQLTDINVEVFWISKRAEIHPFVLSAGGSASLKLLFERK